MLVDVVREHTSRHDNLPPLWYILLDHPFNTPYAKQPAELDRLIIFERSGERRSSSFVIGSGGRF